MINNLNILNPFIGNVIMGNNTIFCLNIGEENI